MSSRPSAWRRVSFTRTSKISRSAFSRALVMRRKLSKVAPDDHLDPAVLRSPLFGLVRRDRPKLPEGDVGEPRGIDAELLHRTDELEPLVLGEGPGVFALA